MRICIFEDNLYANFLPLVHFRPVYDLRCGVMSLREKITVAIPRAEMLLHVRVDLKEILAEEYPQYPVNVPPDEQTWFINGRLLADEHLTKIIKRHHGGNKVFVSNGQLALAFIKEADVLKFWNEFAESLFPADILQKYPNESYPGVLMQYPWELVHHTAGEIEKDAKRLRKKKAIAGKVYPGANIINRKNVLIGKGSVVKPGAVLDAEKGPIIIGNNVTIMPNAVIEGPAYIGDHSIIKIGAKVYHGTSIGMHCKVGGEVEASIIQSYSNKQHDGFLGHSYLGSWVNIGADTNTSDLKNTYGNVNVHVNGSLVNTGLQFVGLTMGDHSKTGINVMFDTGSVIGVSCNIYGAGLPPKYLPSFCWGEKNGFSVYDLEKSIATARRVMARRDVQMTSAYEILMRSVFTASGVERNAAKIL